ncbi:MAG: hypothetical protein HND48_01970 [Chloroflexi bacterium]|nr:hypothetical protein [Chloroflexota bacterium]
MLEQRGTALDLLESLLRQSRRDRFALANDLAGDKPAPAAPARIMADVLARPAAALRWQQRVKPVNTDRIATLEQLSRVLRVEFVETALRQTQRAQTLIQGTNVNVRLLLEVLFLDYPAA